ncbi:MAG: prolyl oligopeptidase family serine peptidase, partial [Proteobacteria bacterium]|nr:prolyl oligopeptidase family serine peptidase [Pseudomonadota bacterium]
MDREKDGDLVREKVSYGVGKGCRGSAYLLYQEQPDKIRRPAVLAIHGHGGDFSQGKSKVVRARNTSDTYGYGRGLAQRGFVVLAPDMAGFEDRQLIIESRQTPWPFDPERLLHCGLLLHGATLMGLYLFELQRALDFLCHCQDMVDPTRIAVIGHSMGGTLAPMLMLIDQRVCAGVSAAGLATWRSLLDFAVIHNFGAYLPGVLPGSDLDAMLCQLAPRPLMVIAGEQDPNFPLAGVNALVSSLKKIYAQKGRSENLAIMIHPGGHPFTEEQQSRAWVFL